MGVNYRASQRSKSTADFINKLKIVEEEVDESNFFLDLLYEISKIENLKLNNEFHLLLKESEELLAITLVSIKTKKNNPIK